MRLPRRRGNDLQLTIVNVSSYSDREDADPCRFGQVCFGDGRPALFRGRAVRDEYQQARDGTGETAAAATGAEHLVSSGAQGHGDVGIAASDLQALYGIDHVVHVVVGAEIEADIDDVAELQQSYLRSNINMQTEDKAPSSSWCGRRSKWR